ncbi:MAG: hypothetical protein AAGI67_04880 [Pseudomonadota bacterium]
MTSDSLHAGNGEAGLTEGPGSISQPGSLHRLPEEAITEIAGDIIANLADSLASTLAPNGGGADRLSPLQLDLFCEALTCPDQQRAERVIDQAILSGVSMDTLYLGYFAGAAERLGECWAEDTRTFVEMTIASGRLHAIMRKLRRSMVPPLPNNSRHAFFTAVPGEYHTLGVTIAADMFRRRGWDIEVETSKPHKELVSLFSRSDHQFLGISASRPDMIVSLAKLILDCRVSKPRAHIMVSGHITDLEPNLGNLIDVDFIAQDAHSAIDHMEQVRIDWLSSEPAKLL